MASAFPGSVLFACTLNAIRSPMAEALLRRLHGARIYVASAGVDEAPMDPLTVAVMDELGVDLRNHKTQTFDELGDTSFDLIVALSPEAHARALEATRITACDVEYWPVPDPTVVEGSCEAVLSAYRSVRDALAWRIRERFPGQKP